VCGCPLDQHRHFAWRNNRLVSCVVELEIPLRLRCGFQRRMNAERFARRRPSPRLEGDGLPVDPERRVGCRTRRPCNPRRGAPNFRSHPPSYRERAHTGPGNGVKAQLALPVFASYASMKPRMPVLLPPLTPTMMRFSGQRRRCNAVALGVIEGAHPQAHCRSGSRALLRVQGCLGKLVPETRQAAIHASAARTNSRGKPSADLLQNGSAGARVQRECAVICPCAVNSSPVDNERRRLKLAAGHRLICSTSAKRGPPPIFFCT